MKFLWNLEVEVWWFALLELAADAAAIRMKTARNLVLGGEIKLWLNVNTAETITTKPLR